MANRPSRRTLVRWNDDHDKELLLWIVYCCNEQGIKVPFARIAQCMGPSFTEGACIQHLAKIRTKMEVQGLHVPPAQKRGTVTRTASSIYRPKVKPISAPVPRVRQDLPDIQTDDGFFDDDEEEEIEEHFAKESPPARRASRKNARRQASAKKSSSVVKDDSEGDDLEPALYDSDKEYGAKKISDSLTNQPEQRVSQLIQQSLDFGNNTMASQHSEFVGSTIMEQPNLKYESADMAPTYEPLELPQPRGTRRKSSAMAVDDDGDDEEYDPGSQSKSRSKKPRASRVTNKKQRVNSKSKNNPKTAGHPESKVGRQETATADIDRMRMPPPTRPAHSTKSQQGWDSELWNNPITASNAFDNHTYHGYNLSDGTWSDNSAVIQRNSGFDFDQDPNTFHANFDPYPLPDFHYNTSGMPSTTSAPNTRNASWASGSSASTIESQPARWSQPIRTSTFPNPQEASAVLARAVNTVGADASTQINVFEPSIAYKGGNSSANLAAPMDFTLNDYAQDMNMRDEDDDSLFIGQPGARDDFGWSDYLDDA